MSSPYSTYSFDVPIFSIYSKSSVALQHFCLPFFSDVLIPIYSTKGLFVSEFSHRIIAGNTAAPKNFVSNKSIIFLTCPVSTKYRLMPTP